MEGKLLTAQEVADILKIKKNTVYELVKRGELPSKKVGKQVRISERVVSQYLYMAAPRDAGAPQTLQPDQDGQIILCGQDLSLDLIANHVRSFPDLPNILRSHAGSYNSLHSLYQGTAQIGTSHLWDERSKEYNYPYISKLVPGIPLVVIRLFGRMQGYYVKKGNPKQIGNWEDLRRHDIRIVVREKGSGTRVLLDEKLKVLSIDRNGLTGYDREYTSHLLVAGAVARGDGDFGLGSERGCRQFDDIGFVPLQKEWYDMVFFAENEHKDVFRAVADYVCSEEFRSELTAMGGYDVAETGRIVHL